MDAFPPGALGTGVYSDGFAGTWSGPIVNLLPVGFELGEPYDVTITVASPETAAAVWDPVGRVEYADGTTGPVLMMYPVECLGHTAGPDPAWMCFQFAEDHTQEDNRLSIDPAFNFQAFVLSLQRSTTGGATAHYT
jgi:hypothetical protein